jgi:hypothetical protein
MKIIFLTEQKAKSTLTTQAFKYMQYVPAVMVNVSLLKCYSFLKNICFICLSNKFEVKFSGSDRFLMIHSGIS